MAGHLSGLEQRWYLWEGNGKYPLPLQTLLFPFLPVKPIMPTQSWQTPRQEGPQVWPHYLSLLPDDMPVALPAESVIAG